MKPIIRFTDAQMAELQAHLFGGGPDLVDEACAFAYATEVPDRDQPILLVNELHPVPSDAFDVVGPDGFELRQEAKVEAVLRARHAGRCLIEIHSHPHSWADDDVRFSVTDHEGQREFQRYLSWKHPGTWAALVFGRRSADGAFWRHGATIPTPLARVTSAGRPWRLPESHAELDRVRFDRQIRAYGADSQERLDRVRVGLVGCGGLGSYVGQQLVRLGVRQFVLIDDDAVSASNLNRLPHAFRSDVRRLKVNVMADYIRQCTPDAEVEVVAASVRSRQALETLRFCDILIGCVDNDGARVVLSYLATAYLMPYIDAASDVRRMADFVYAGGRVYGWRPGLNCVDCEGLIDHEETRDILGTKDEHVTRAKLGYGGPSEEPAASVVHVNAHVAASTVAEFHALVAGGVAKSHREYRADRGTERTLPKRPRRAYCPVCWEGVGRGDQLALDRFMI